MSYKFSVESKQKTIAFLREYIELCLKHKAIVTGIIGAKTALSNFWDKDNRYWVEGQVRSNVYGIITNLYDDSGNREISDADISYIYDAVKDLLPPDK